MPSNNAHWFKVLPFQSGAVYPSMGYPSVGISTDTQGDALQPEVL